jgi:protein involved in polysaccharide export with SLBB domain
VFGQVNRGGLIEIPPERKMTVVEAITAAGGLNPKARESDIQINRKGRTLRYHMRDLRRMENPVYVEPDDVIFVPESRI